MRVIAGSAKRLELKTLDGMDTRPTTDRIKETLFNMIAPYLYGCIFLDLFSGSGGIGIEALSRGAMAMMQLEGTKTFDYIFLDPPYRQELEKEVLDYLAGSSLVYEDTVIIVEAAKDTDFSYVGKLGFTLLKEKVYKTNKHVFLEKTGKEEIC